MNKRDRSAKLTPNQSSRLAAYFAAGVAASLGVSSESEASNTIVYFSIAPENQSVGLGESVSFGSINLSNGTYVLGGSVAPNFTISGVGTSLFEFAGAYSIGIDTTPGYYTDATNFSLNSTISSSPYFQLTSLIGANQFYGGDWGPGATGFIGLRINQGTDYYYGWADLAFSPTEGGATTITGFAFETRANTPIEAGAIPEPSTVALAGVAALILGGSAYVRSRRRREEALKEAA